MAKAGSVLGRVPCAVLGDFLCGCWGCASAKPDSRKKHTSERCFGFILWQFYQPAGSPHAIPYNGLKSSRGNMPTALFRSFHQALIAQVLQVFFNPGVLC